MCCFSCLLYHLAQRVRGGTILENWSCVSLWIWWGGWGWVGWWNGGGGAKLLEFIQKPKLLKTTENRRKISSFVIEQSVQGQKFMLVGKHRTIVQALAMNLDVWRFPKSSQQGSQHHHPSVNTRRTSNRFICVSPGQIIMASWSVFPHSDSLGWNFFIFYLFSW